MKTKGHVPMHIFLRSLAFPVACAFTGAAAALLVAHLIADAPPPAAPTCPNAPVLQIHPYPYPAPPPPAPPPPPLPGPEFERLQIPPDAVRCSSDGRCSIDRVFFATVIDNPLLLARQARVMPSIREGEMRGLKFYGLRPGSLPRLLGLKNGDLLTAINGVPVTGIDDLVTVPSPLAHLTFVLDIERKGEPVQLRVGID
jgi:hypothetical protein